MRRVLNTPSFLPGGATEEQSRKKRERQKLIVRTKKGHVHYGMCFALNRNAPGFHLDLQDKNGRPLNRTLHVSFDDIKAVFYVKSFDGRFNPEDFQPISVSRNQPIAIEFEDNEVLLGRPVHATWRDEPRFYVVPEEQDTNNIMVLVERNAIKAIHDLNEYKKQRQEEFSAYVKAHRKPGMSKEECIGDFYFSQKDYKNALRHYRSARGQEELTETLKKKLCAAKYNLGMRHIKQRDYAKALQLMELALKVDPTHPKALQKAKQLRTHIAKHKSDPILEEHNPLL